MGVAADRQQQRQAEGSSPGQAGSCSRVGFWPTLPPEQSAKGESRHHQQRVADGDREGVVGPLGQKQPEQTGARQQPGVEADERDKQKGQAVAEEIQQGLTRWIHQLLKQQQGLAQGVAHHSEA